VFKDIKKAVIKSKICLKTTRFWLPVFEEVTQSCELL